MIKIENVNISKIDLENGRSYYLIEKNNEEVGRDLGTCTIILVENGICVGFISSTIFNDNTASLTTALITYDMLPVELKKYYEIFRNHDGYAIYVEENFRGLSKAKELIFLMLSHLRDKGIVDVKIYSIVSDIAWKTYLSTGAIPINYKTALYQDLDKLLSSDIFTQFTNQRR